METRVLVSACLCGRACRFDGGDKKTPDLLDALQREGVEIVPQAVPATWICIDSPAGFR